MGSETLPEIMRLMPAHTRNTPPSSSAILSGWMTLMALGYTVMLPQGIIYSAGLIPKSPTAASPSP